MNQSIEAIFAPENLDEDCSHISKLMAPVANAIDQDLIDDQPADAVDLFLQLVGCWKRIVKNLGWFPEEVIGRLRVMLGEFCGAEAYQGYGYPGIGKWKEMVGMYGSEVGDEWQLLHNEGE